MSFFNELIKDDPVIQNLLAQSELAGEIKGKIEGKIEELKKSILNLLSIRFSPALAAQARPAVMAVQAYETLEMLFNLVAKAPDEQTALLAFDLPNG